MPSLSSYPNVWETCLQLLQRRGYRLWLELDEDGATDLWHAERDGFTFLADDPIQLLGLTAVYEDVRPEQDREYWWSDRTVKESPLVREQLLEAALARQEAAELA